MIVAAPTDTVEFSLDHAATTTLRAAARSAMIEAWDMGLGNASGTHATARRAKNLLEAARERAAELLGLGRAMGIVFTSGGTESDNLAIKGAAAARRGSTIVVSSIEHKAVLESARSMRSAGYTIRLVAPDRHGVVHPDAVMADLDESAAVVSVMAANNELGTVQPIHAIVEAVRRTAPGVPVHTDAVQAFVGAAIDMGSLDVDLLSLSAHKFGGPQGVGLLAIAESTTVEPILHGGGHEAGRRSGTSNVAGILGMVAAMEEAEADRERFRSAIGRERDMFEASLLEHIPDAHITTEGATRMPHVAHVRIPGVRAETLLILLDRHGVRASAGSACQSGAIEPSHVLSAIGMPDEAAAECVRFSFGWDTSPGLGSRAARVVADVVAEAGGS